MIDDASMEAVCRPTIQSTDLGKLPLLPVVWWEIEDMLSDLDGPSELVKTGLGEEFVEVPGLRVPSGLGYLSPASESGSVCSIKSKLSRIA